MATFQDQLQERYEQRRHDPERPILPPEQLFLGAEQAEQALMAYPRVELHQQTLETEAINFATTPPPDLSLRPQSDNPAAQLQDFLRYISRPGIADRRIRRPP